MRKILGSVGYAAAVVMLVPALTLAASFFYVADDGSIGIGTSSPLHKLDVVGAIYSRLVTLTSSSTVAVNWNSGNVQTLTLSTSPTLTFSNGQAGGEYKLILKQDSTGGRTVTWPAGIKWAEGIVPTLTTSANGIDVIEFINDGTNYLGSYHLSYGNLNDNLVGYWKLDNNSNDASGNAHHGSDTSITYTGGNGILNQGAGLVHASSSYISVTDASALKPTGDFSVNMWIKTSYSTNLGNNINLFQSYSQNSIVSGIQIDLQTSDFKPRFVSGSGANNTLGSGYQQVVGNTALNDGNWHMYTFVYNGLTLSIYRDGASVPDNSVAWSTDPGYAGTNYVAIGIQNNAGTPSSLTGFEGSIDEVGYWGKALSATEISNLYNSGSALAYPF